MSVTKPNQNKSWLAALAVCLLGSLWGQSEARTGTIRGKVAVGSEQGGEALHIRRHGVR